MNQVKVSCFYSFKFKIQPTNMPVKSIPDKAIKAETNFAIKVCGLISPNPTVVNVTIK